MLNSAVFRSDISEQEAEKAMDEKKQKSPAAVFPRRAAAPGLRSYMNAVTAAV